MTEHSVSVAIVSFNAKEKLRRCLVCIEAHHEVIVVDNASTDGAAEMIATEFPHVKLIANDVNRGFGEANNQAMDAATGDLVLLLNSDAYAFPGAIDSLAKVFEDGGVVAAGGRLLNLDGSLQNSSAGKLTLWVVFCEQVFVERLFPMSRVLSPYWNSARLGGCILGVGDDAPPQETPQVMGACLMLRPVERFDPRYFLYCEDTDLCLRLAKHGRILYVPAAKFYHELGSSSGQDRWRAVARYNRGKELYFQIHHGRLAGAACLCLNRLGAALRLLTWSLVALFTAGCRGRDLVKRFWHVLCVSLAGPDDPRNSPEHRIRR
jgi:hypothetical protein